MYKNKRILGIIPARGGSKGIPHKNIANLYGKPLISYTIEEARASLYIDELIVSTDDEKIKEVAELCGARVPFLRPKEYSTDTSKSIDVVLHSIDEMSKLNFNYDFIILLQPTSPFRSRNSIDLSIKTLLDTNKDSLVSLCEVEENPLLMRTISEDKLVNVVQIDSNNVRRQEFPKFYILNGAIYINNILMLKEKKAFVDKDSVPFIMNKEESVDIDNYNDLKFAEFLLKEKNNE